MMFVNIVLLFLIGCYTSASIPLQTLCANRTIITFGDSLTHGLYQTTEPRDKIGYHPYAKELQNLFKNYSVVVEEKGLSGEKASDLMYLLPPILKEKRKDPIFVVILAGTNDLAARLGHKSIVWHVRKMHNAVQQHALHIKRNIYTIALSIPQMRWDMKESDRISVNRDIREYALRCNSSVSYLDLNEKFNQSKPEDAKMWSSDYVHFSRVGYDILGKMVFNKMEEIATTKTEASLTTMDFTSVCNGWDVDE